MSRVMVRGFFRTMTGGTAFGADIGTVDLSILDRRVGDWRQIIRRQHDRRRGRR